MNPNLQEDYIELSRTVISSLLTEFLISSYPYLRFKFTSSLKAPISIREASTGIIYTLFNNQWSELLNGSSGIYVTIDPKDSNAKFEIKEYEPNFKNIVDDSHNWGEQTAAEAGEGQHYFPDTEEIVYSNGEKFIRNTHTRTTPLKIVYFGDSRCEVLKIATPPHPVGTNPVILTFGGSGVANVFTCMTNFSDLASYYPLARLAANYGIGGETTSEIVARDVSLSTGKAVTDMISLGAHVCISRFGINNITGLLAANSAEVTEQAYSDLVSESKILILRTLKAGIFHIFEGVEGYSYNPGVNLTLRQSYSIRYMAEMGAYIESLNSNLVEFVNPIGLTCDSTGAYLPLMSFDGLHQSGYGGKVKAAYTTNILNRRFGLSLGIAYPGYNYADAVSNPMMLTKVTGANGDLATGIIIGTVSNSTAIGTIEEIDGITYQSMVLTTGSSGTASAAIKISLTPGTVACSATDTIACECDVRIEGLDGLLTASTTLSFDTTVKQLSIGGSSTIAASITQLAGVDIVADHLVCPPSLIGIDYSDQQFMTLKLNCSVQISEIGVGKRIKFSWANVRLVKNPT